MEKIINDGRIDLTMDRVFSRTKSENSKIRILDNDIKVTNYASLNPLFRNRINFTIDTTFTEFTFISKTQQLWYNEIYNTDAIVPDKREYIGKDKIKADVLGQYDIDPSATKDSYRCPVCGKVNEKLLLNKVGSSSTIVICDKCIEAVPHIFSFKEAVFAPSTDTHTLEKFEDRLFYYGIDMTDYVDNVTYIRRFLHVGSNKLNLYYENDSPRSTNERVEHEVELMSSLKEKPDPEMRINLF